MEDAFLDFFVTHKRVFLTFHLIGVAVGMGGATITDILFFNFLRDFTISKKEAEVMRILSNVIMVALLILYVSGGALFLSNPDIYGQSAAFLSKGIIVVILTVNGVLMHKLIAPHMVHFSFSQHPIHTRRKLHRLRAIAFGMGAISFTSWYSVFMIAMLKSYLPAEISIPHIMRWYALVLFVAILVSQFVHRHLHRKSMHL